MNVCAEHVVLQSDYYAYKSVFSALQSMVREGPRTLFQGFSATALRDGPYAGMYLMFYEGIKIRLGGCLDPLAPSGCKIWLVCRSLHCRIWSAWRWWCARE